jgi:hypothetical protein
MGVVPPPSRIEPDQRFVGTRLDRTQRDLQDLSDFSVLQALKIDQQYDRSEMLR